MLGLIVVDHGSRRSAANALLATVADDLRRLRPDGVVAECHMELAEPNIAQAVATVIAQGADEVVVLLYFLGPGRHSHEDIPRMVGEAMAAHPQVSWRIAEPLGPHLTLAELALERAGLKPVISSGATIPSATQRAEIHQASVPVAVPVAVSVAAPAPTWAGLLGSVAGRSAALISALGWGICIVGLFMDSNRAFAALRDLGAGVLPYDPMVDYWIRMAALVFTVIGFGYAGLAMYWTKAGGWRWVGAWFQVLCGVVLLLAARLIRPDSDIVVADILFSFTTGTFMLFGALMLRSTPSTRSRYSAPA